MAKKSKAFSDRKRALTDTELLASFDQSLITLEHLAATYDGGYAPIALLMATEVQKILTENHAATRLRGTRSFSTPDNDDNPNVLTALHKLTAARIGGEPAALTFVPQFYLPGSLPIRQLAFRDWWNNDIIYRASAAPIGTPPGMIPINGSPTVPFDKRENISRRTFVSLLRNKLSAHQSSELPGLLDDLEHTLNWGAFAVNTPQGVLSTIDGTLPTTTGMIPAMMRQICHEILIAYDRVDTGPA